MSHNDKTEWMQTAIMSHNDKTEWMQTATAFVEERQHEEEVLSSTCSVKEDVEWRAVATSFLDDSDKLQAPDQPPWKDVKAAMQPSVSEESKSQNITKLNDTRESQLMPSSAYLSQHSEGPTNMPSGIRSWNSNGDCQPSSIPAYPRKQSTNPPMTPPNAIGQHHMRVLSSEARQRLQKDDYTIENRGSLTSDIPSWEMLDAPPPSENSSDPQQLACLGNLHTDPAWKDKMRHQLGLRVPDWKRKLQGYVETRRIDLDQSKHITRQKKIVELELELHSEKEQRQQYEQNTQQRHAEMRYHLGTPVQKPDTYLSDSDMSDFESTSLRGEPLMLEESGGEGIDDIPILFEKGATVKISQSHSDTLLQSRIATVYTTVNDPKQGTVILVQVNGMAGLFPVLPQDLNCQPEGFVFSLQTSKFSRGKRVTISNQVGDPLLRNQTATIQSCDSDPVYGEVAHIKTDETCVTASVPTKYLTSLSIKEKTINKFKLNDRVKVVNLPEKPFLNSKVGTIKQHNSTTRPHTYTVVIKGSSHEFSEDNIILFDDGEVLYSVGETVAVVDTTEDPLLRGIVSEINRVLKDDVYKVVYELTHRNTTYRIPQRDVIGAFSEFDVGTAVLVSREYSNPVIAGQLAEVMSCNYNRVGGQTVDLNISGSHHTIPIQFLREKPKGILKTKSATTDTHISENSEVLISKQSLNNKIVSRVAVESNNVPPPLSESSSDITETTVTTQTDTTIASIPVLLTSKGFSVGEDVTIVGLVKNSDLNNKNGTITKLTNHTQYGIIAQVRSQGTDHPLLLRYLRHLSNDQSKPPPTEITEGEDPQVGSIITTHSLTKFPELNGKQGVVTKISPHKQFGQVYVVSIAGFKEPHPLLRKNLNIVKGSESQLKIGGKARVQGLVKNEKLNDKNALVRGMSMHEKYGKMFEVKVQGVTGTQYLLEKHVVVADHDYETESDSESLTDSLTTATDTETTETSTNLSQSTLPLSPSLHTLVTIIGLKNQTHLNRCIGIVRRISSQQNSTILHLQIRYKKIGHQAIRLTNTESVDIVMGSSVVVTGATVEGKECFKGQKAVVKSITNSNISDQEPILTVVVNKETCQVSVLDVQKVSDPTPVVQNVSPVQAKPTPTRGTAKTKGAKYRLGGMVTIKDLKKNSNLNGKVGIVRRIADDNSGWILHLELAGKEGLQLMHAKNVARRSGDDQLNKKPKFKEGDTVITRGLPTEIDGFSATVDKSAGDICYIRIDDKLVAVFEGNLKHTLSVDVMDPSQNEVFFFDVDAGNAVVDSILISRPLKINSAILTKSDGLLKLSCNDGKITACIPSSASRIQVPQLRRLFVAYGVKHNIPPPASNLYSLDMVVKVSGLSHLSHLNDVKGRVAGWEMSIKEPSVIETVQVLLPKPHGKMSMRSENLVVM